MIDSAIGLLAAQLNQHLRRRYSLSEDVAVMSNLLDASGGAVTGAANKLVFFLGGLDREVTKSSGAARGRGGDQLASPDPIFLNLLLVCAANFSGARYPQALRYLSEAIGFFQGRPVFNHQNAPGMDTRIEQLVLAIENLTPSEVHSLWSLQGGRYLPAVHYRIRLIGFGGDTVTQRQPRVTGLDAQALAE